MRTFDQHLRHRLEDLQQRDLLRRPRVIAAAHGPLIETCGSQVIGLCSNDYLGLSTHPDLAFPIHLTGAGASRQIAGTHTVHLEAESAFAAFLGHPASLLFTAGYAANVGAIQALMGPGDVVFSDALNHASLIDGCRLSGAIVVVFPHRDYRQLEVLLGQHRAEYRSALLITESLFSMDGDEADLPTLRRLADAYAAGLYVDEAHALGVFGRHGAGLCSEQGIQAEIVLGTLGKAFGLAGAFVAGSVEAVDLIQNRARSYVFSTAPPPALARAAMSALSLVVSADAARRQLLRHAGRLRDGLREAGYEVPAGRSQIVPCLVGESRDVMALSQALFERGVFVQGIRPPTVAPGTARLRVAPMATHTDEHIDLVLSVFRALA